MSKSDIKKKSVASVYLDAREKIFEVVLGATQGKGKLGPTKILLKEVSREASSIVTVDNQGGSLAKEYTGVFEVVELGSGAQEQYGDVVGWHCLHVQAAGTILGQSDYRVINVHEVLRMWDPKEL